MRTSNPLLTRLSEDAARERAATRHQPYGFQQPPQPHGFQQPPHGFQQPPHGFQQPYGQQPPPYGQPSPVAEGPGGAAPPATRAMTVDDVVIRTIGLLALLTASAGAVWLLTEPAQGWAIGFPAAMIGLVLGLVIAFARVTNPVVIGLYAVIEGVFLGGISQGFNAIWPGIVMQAVIATVGVFLLMAFLYKSGTIRATPKFVKFMIGALVGCAAVILVNLVITLVTGQATILRDGGPIAIIVSIVFIVIAALSFILSFHEVEEGVRHGLPERYAWACSFGILVSLIWLYLEVLRLLSYFSGD